MPETPAVDERVQEALGIARRALAFYARSSHWSEDSWGVRALFMGNYGNPSLRAANALKRMDRALSEEDQPDMTGITAYTDPDPEEDERDG